MDFHKITVAMNCPPIPQAMCGQSNGFWVSQTSTLRISPGVSAPYNCFSKRVWFQWIPDQSAFDYLKWAFTFAPVLVHPNPAIPFRVEADASNFATRAVLSQLQGAQEQLYPYIFYFQKMIPAQANCDI